MRFAVGSLPFAPAGSFPVAVSGMEAEMLANPIAPDTKSAGLSGEHRGEALPRPVLNDSSVRSMNGRARTPLALARAQSAGLAEPGTRVANTHAGPTIDLSPGSKLPAPFAPAREVASPNDAFPGDRVPTPTTPPTPSLADRLSLDAWLFLRPGGSRSVLAGGVGPAAYGRSQVGAILRYRLRPSVLWDPFAYARADAALVSNGERQIALGLGARPVAEVPLVAHVEARVTHQDGRTQLRPAAFVAGGTDALTLPAGFALRSYGQAGYVGGRFESGFADGQAVATRELASFDLGTVRAGAGVWGGAQRGAERLDIGPSAAVTLRLGDAPVRLSFDYRMRVAGDAAPGSGAALTLSRAF
ncbi:MAG: hypothetical protein K5799_03780 [Erythrobacter sp.]|nr:hypothetical protein [Erythrobacter sp.]